MAAWETTLWVYRFQALVLPTPMENKKYQIKEEEQAVDSQACYTRNSHSGIFRKIVLQKGLKAPSKSPASFVPRVVQ